MFLHCSFILAFQFVFIPVFSTFEIYISVYTSCIQLSRLWRHNKLISNFKLDLWNMYQLPKTCSPSSLLAMRLIWQENKWFWAFIAHLNMQGWEEEFSRLLQCSVPAQRSWIVKLPPPKWSNAKLEQARNSP